MPLIDIPDTILSLNLLAKAKAVEKITKPINKIIDMNSGGK